MGRRVPRWRASARDECARPTGARTYAPSACGEHRARSSHQSSLKGWLATRHAGTPLVGGVFCAPRGDARTETAEAAVTSWLLRRGVSPLRARRSVPFDASRLRTESMGWILSPCAAFQSDILRAPRWRSGRSRCVAVSLGRISRVPGSTVMHRVPLPTPPEPGLNHPLRGRSLCPPRSPLDQLKLPGPGRPSAPASVPPRPDDHLASRQWPLDSRLANEDLTGALPGPTSVRALVSSHLLPGNNQPTLDQLPGDQGLPGDHQT